MKTMKKAVSVVLLLCMVTALCSAGAYATGGGTTGGNLVISPDKITLYLNDGDKTKQLDLTAIVKDPALTTTPTSESWSWASGSDTVATVTNDGLITAVAAGTATLTGTYTADTETYTGTLEVTVKETPVTGITFNPTTATVEVGKDLTLAPTVTREDGKTGTNITWSSDNTGIATVTDGTVTGVAVGSANITATAGGQSATCAVTVTAPAAPATVPVTAISFTVPSMTLVTGVTGRNAPVITPVDATDKTVAWSSDNTNVAVVDADGQVTGVAPGTANITATANDGSRISASYTVTVNAVSVDSITLSETALTLTEGDTYELTATVKPDNAANQGVAWGSSDAAVATVDESGKVTAVKKGTATITATAKDGSGVKGTCTVTVNEKPADVAVTGVSIIGANTVVAGGTVQLTANVTPDNATDKTVTWTSSDPTTAQVDGNGLVTAHSQGSVTITATTQDGGKTATHTVTVTQNLNTYITLSATELTIGRTFTTLTATVHNFTGNPAVTWAVTTAPISDGLGLTANANNTATISGRYNGDYVVTATLNTGAGLASASCTVHVRFQPSIIYGNYAVYDGRNAMAFIVNDSHYNFGGSVWVDGVLLTNGYHYREVSSRDGYIQVELAPGFVSYINGAATNHSISISDKTGYNVGGYFRTWGTTSTIHGVKTGDESSVALWTVLCLLSAAGGAAVLLVSRRRREK